MREKHPSFSNVIVDTRFRLDAVIRHTASVTVYAATHRNGSDAWLKLPSSPATAAGVALEARIANTIGSPLTVRDDGITPDGLPYLVMDAPVVESLTSLRAPSAQHQMPLARGMAVGDGLIGLIAALHETGYVAGALADDDVLVLANGEVALLALHAAVPASPSGVAADLLELGRVLALLVAECIERQDPAVDLMGAVVRGNHADAAALRAAWRGVSPVPISAVMRPRMPSVQDFGTLPLSPETPMGVSIAQPSFEELPSDRAPAGSAGNTMLEYLGAANAAESVRLPESRADRQRAVMYDPLARVPEMSRLVHATSVRTDDDLSRRRPAVLAAMVAAPLALVAAAAAVVVLLGSKGNAAPSAAFPRTPAVETTGTPSPVALPKPAPPPAGSSEAPEALELGDEPTVPSESSRGLLRTEDAPVGRRVFLDGRVIGETPLSVAVPCGRHVLQMNPAGASHSIEIPCGGERVVRFDRNGRWSVK